MEKAPLSERRRFLSDLERLAAAVAAPLGLMERPAARTRDAGRGDLVWRLRVEPEEPAFPSMLRLTWGVRVPGVLERMWPPGSREARSWPSSWYEDALWMEDVQQLRTGRDRIYRYRVSSPAGRLSRLNPFAPDYIGPVPEVTAFLVDLVDEVLPPLMRSITSKHDLAAWMLVNPHLCNRRHSSQALAEQVSMLRGG